MDQFKDILTMIGYGDTVVFPHGSVRLYSTIYTEQ